MTAADSLHSEVGEFGALNAGYLPLSAGDLVGRLSRYRGSSTARSITEIGITLFGFMVTWLTIWLALDAGFWLMLILTIPGAGFLVRLFMIQHDCGHGSFFRRKRTNDWTGRVLSILTRLSYRGGG
jgi:acyl-lipid omega-6 desaturase (Delta-12 desaturase)